MYSWRGREETEQDYAAVRLLNQAAFEGEAEARLIEGLRQKATPLISLIAEADGELVGHILFSPVTHSGDAELKLMGLAPMAVAPASQRSGIGSALIEAGLARCQAIGAAGVVVLGHPNYYPRFGFKPARTFGLVSEFKGVGDAFMAREIAGGLDVKAGLVKYHPEFSRL